MALDRVGAGNGEHALGDDLSGHRPRAGRKRHHRGGRQPSTAGRPSWSSRATATTSATRCGCASWATWDSTYNKEAFATFAYNKMNATERMTGSVGGYPLYTRFSNTSALDLEGGLRYYFLPEGPTRTYVAGVAGVRFQDRVGATIRVLGAGADAERPRLLREFHAVHLRRRYRHQPRPFRHDRDWRRNRPALSAEVQARANPVRHRSRGHQRHR